MFSKNIYFILKIFSFSFERTKENETKENSSQPETSPHTLRQTVGLQQGIAKRYFLINFCIRIIWELRFYIASRLNSQFSILNSHLTLGFGASKNNFL